MPALILNLVVIFTWVSVSIVTLLHVFDSPQHTDQR